MSILLVRSPHSFSIFNRSMIQADTLPLSDILNNELIVSVFEEEKIQFGIADEGRWFHSHSSSIIHRGKGLFGLCRASPDG